MATKEKAITVENGVEILIPLGSDPHEPNYQYIAVNGKSYKVKKGEPVKVPEEVKEVWDNSIKAQQEMLDRIRKESQKESR